MNNFGVNLVVALLLPTAVWRYLDALRNPRRRVWRDDRRAMRRHDAMRKALR